MTKCIYKISKYGLYGSNIAEFGDEMLQNAATCYGVIIDDRDRWWSIDEDYILDTLMQNAEFRQALVESELEDDFEKYASLSHYRKITGYDIEKDLFNSFCDQEEVGNGFYELYDILKAEADEAKEYINNNTDIAVLDAEELNLSIDCKVEVDSDKINEIQAALNKINKKYSDQLKTADFIYKMNDPVFNMPLFAVKYQAWNCTDEFDIKKVGEIKNNSLIKQYKIKNTGIILKDFNYDVTLLLQAEYGIIIDLYGIWNADWKYINNVLKENAKFKQTLIDNGFDTNFFKYKPAELYEKLTGESIEQLFKQYTNHANIGAYFSDVYNIVHAQVEEAREYLENNNNIDIINIQENDEEELCINCIIEASESVANKVQDKLNEIQNKYASKIQAMSGQHYCLIDPQFGIKLCSVTIRPNAAANGFKLYEA